MVFRSPPAKVHNYVTKLLKANLIKEPPVWYSATTLSPPSPTLLRQRDLSGVKLDAQLPFEGPSEPSDEWKAPMPQWFAHLSGEQKAKAEEARAEGAKEEARENESTTTASASSSIPVRSSRCKKHLRWKTERPRKIVYPEDRLRRRFYEDHPWELRRPRCLIETTGDGTQRDWSSLLQKGRSISDLTGEDVIQHQLYLMSTGMTEREAYHAATQEFYLIRAQEETEARVAKAQAMAFGLKPRRSFVMSGLKREEEALLEAEKNASMF
ncbi:MAG: mitochondrial ribosomal protein S25-domain-containing protein [Benniella sp.]|nr:MAG: mitochondrial ribosomal protein S25-domain-containing protein [Benniella sp.]